MLVYDVYAICLIVILLQQDLLSWLMDNINMLVNVCEYVDLIVTLKENFQIPNKFACPNHSFLPPFRNFIIIWRVWF